jgi:hypothetical protein
LPSVKFTLNGGTNINITNSWLSTTYGWNSTTGPSIALTNTGNIISANTTTAALIINLTMPPGTSFKFVNDAGAYIVGKGGSNGSSNNGGHAIQALSNLQIVNSGIIGGGGGAGCGWNTGGADAGGGGAGYGVGKPAQTNVPGCGNGSLTAGGGGCAFYGNGSAGGNAVGNTGGSAGLAGSTSWGGNGGRGGDIGVAGASCSTSPVNGNSISSGGGGGLGQNGGAGYNSGSSYTAANLPGGTAGKALVGMSFVNGGSGLTGSNGTNYYGTQS